MSEILRRTLAESRAKLVAYTEDRQLEQVVMLTREWEHIDAAYAKSLTDARNTDNRIQNPKADNVSYNGSWYPAGPLAAIGTSDRSVTIREKLVRSTSSSENDVGRQWTYDHAVNWGETRNIIVEEDMTAVSRDNFLTSYATPTNGKFYSINVSRNQDMLWDITVTERTGVAGSAEWNFPTRNGTGHKWWGANQPNGTFSTLINTTIPLTYSTDAYDISHTHTPKDEYNLEDYTVAAIPRSVSWDFNSRSTHYYTYIQKQEKKPTSPSGLSETPVDGTYWRTVTVKFEQKFSRTNTAATNHITGGMAGSEIKTRSSADAYFVSIKIVSVSYGTWSDQALPVNVAQAPIVVP